MVDYADVVAVFEVPVVLCDALYVVHEDLFVPMAAAEDQEARWYQDQDQDET